MNNQHGDQKLLKQFCVCISVCTHGRFILKKESSLVGKDLGITYAKKVHLFVTG